MINLIRIIQNLVFNNSITKVYRFPPAKQFHSHQMGLTCGLFFALMYLFYPAVTTTALNFEHFLIGLILLAGTCYLGWAIILVALINMLFNLQIGNAIIDIYFWAYLAGALFVIIYNDLVYLWLWLFESGNIKIVFAHHHKQKINIIKSPKLNEETVKLDSQQCLYDFKKSDSADFHPYTIVFWANRYFNDKKNNVIKPDPISKDRNLFYRSVEKALTVFESNEVLGRPEIWPNIRIITIFEGVENSQNAAPIPYAQSAEFIIDGEIIENLLLPDADLDVKYRQFVENQINTKTLSEEAKKALAEKVDVIYVLSAIEGFTRATSCYADIKGLSKSETASSKNGIAFNFEYKIYDTKKYEDEKRYETTSIKPEKPYACVHDFYAEMPGKIAINVRTATLKTYIHEFAHAMSSAWHGTIVDEYFDEIDTLDNELLDYQAIPFYVNRFVRQKSGNGKLLGIPHTFAVYQQTSFQSDLAHPSATENWMGYFPARHRKDINCTMDASTGTHRFDNLIAAFMYDRLITKINRS